MSIFNRGNDRGFVGFGGNISGTLLPEDNKRSFLDIFGRNRSKRSIKHFRIMAPPRLWGPWQEVFAQAGVFGPSPEGNFRRISISLSTMSYRPSSFDYEIKGGDRFIRGFAGATGASETVTISGNVATAISVRCKSHSTAQRIIVIVR